MSIIEDKPEVLKFFKNKHEGRKTFESLGWRDYASIRLLDYIENAGREFEDLNLKGEVAISNPIKMIWLPTQFGVGGAKPYFFEDMIYLFKQLSGKIERKLPTREQVEKWMERWPSGFDPRIIKLREENKERILNIIIDRMDKGEISSRSFKFGPDMTREEKYSLPPLKRITVAFSSVYFSSLAAIMTAWLRGVAFGVDGVNDFHKLFRYHLDTGMSD